MSEDDHRCPGCGMPLSPSIDPNGGWQCLNDLCPRDEEFFEADLREDPDDGVGTGDAVSDDGPTVEVTALDPATVALSVDGETVELDAVDAVQLAERLREAAVGGE